jgi:hypothetical protein
VFRNFLIVARSASGWARALPRKGKYSPDSSVGLPMGWARALMMFTTCQIDKFSTNVILVLRTSKINYPGLSVKISGHFSDFGRSADGVHRLGESTTHVFHMFN